MHSAAACHGFTAHNAAGASVRKTAGKEKMKLFNGRKSTFFAWFSFVFHHRRDCAYPVTFGVDGKHHTPMVVWSAETTG